MSTVVTGEAGSVTQPVTSNLDTIPTMAEGGSRFGWHFCALFKTCPLKWYNRFLRPHPSGGTGCEPTYTGKALLQGSWMHTFVEHYYASGWENGAYKLEAGIEALRASVKEREAEVHPDDTAEALAAQVEEWGMGYHQWWGPGSPHCDFPTYRIAPDSEGLPLLEREFEIDLGYNGYIFTARLDKVCLKDGDYLTSLETKTSDVSLVGRLVQRWQLDGQGTGQTWLLQQCYPDSLHKPLELDVVVKRAKNRPPYMREPIVRTEADIEKFRTDIVRTLAKIDDAIGEYRRMCDMGMSEPEAAAQVFDGTPDGYTCVGNYACEWFQSCTSKGHEQQWFEGHSRARSKDETINMRGRPEG